MTTNTPPGAKVAAQNRPYSGYYQREVPEPDSEIMRTGPGTPMGEFFRRFWLPVCLSEQVKDLPLALRIMSEDLVVFRSKEGKVGLLHRHCSHRGASLEYGIVEEKGLRCCYHGWVFGNDGTLLEAPSEPANSPIVGKLCQGAYPAFERNGLVFAYMGPPELKPEFEETEFTARADNTLVPYTNHFGCNWLQVQENIADPYHTAIFHNGVGNAALREQERASTSLPKAWGALPVMDYRETESGAGMIYIATRRIEDNIWVRINHFHASTNIEIGTLFGSGRQEVFFQRVSLNRWVVPHDDESCTIFAWRHFNDYVDKGEGDARKLGLEGCDFLGGQVGGRPYEVAQREPGDWEVIMSQRKMARHGLEHLRGSDAGVAMWRRLMRKAVRGETPASLPAPAAGDRLYSEPRRSYAQDTIMRIPALADDESDRKLMREIGNQVADIVIGADTFPPGPQRDAVIVEQLKALDRRYKASATAQGT